jgi:hypothetical protein
MAAVIACLLTETRRELGKLALQSLGGFFLGFRPLPDRLGPFCRP